MGFYRYYFNIKLAGWLEDRPITKLLVTLPSSADADNFPPEFILNKLKNGIEEVINTLINELNIKSTPQSIVSYNEISNDSLSLYNQIAQIPTVSQFAARSFSWKKMAFVDSGKYSAIKEKMRDPKILDEASKIDGSIAFLVSELKQLVDGQPANIEKLILPDPPNIEEVETEEKKETKPEQLFLPQFSDFLNRLATMDPASINKLATDIHLSAQEKINNPSITENIKEKLIERKITVKNTINNLDALKRIITEGMANRQMSIPSAERKYFSNRFEKMLKDVSPYFYEIEKSDNFENVLINNPILISTIMKNQLGLELKPEDLKRPERPATDLEGGQQGEGRSSSILESGRLINVFKDIPGAQEFFERHDIKDATDFSDLSQWFDQKIMTPLVNDLSQNPLQYIPLSNATGIEDSKIPDIQKRAVALNQAATQYSMYQIITKQERIWSLISSIINAEKGEFTGRYNEDLKTTISECFPEKLIAEQWELMSSAFPEDAELLSTKSVVETNPKKAIKNEVLYQQKQVFYDETINQIMEKWKKGKEAKQILPFLGRTSLGNVFSMAYGGGYRKNSFKSHFERQQAIEDLTYKGFTNRDYVLYSFSDSSLPFWGSKLPNLTKNMQEMHNSFSDSINNFSLKQEESGQITEDEGLRAAFMLSYLGMSSKLFGEYNKIRSQNNIIREDNKEREQQMPEIPLPKPKPDEIFGDWLEEYRSIVTASSFSLTKYTYHYPVKYLLK